MNERNTQPRQMIPGQWFWLEKGIVRDHLPQIGASGLAAYCFLALCVDEKQECFPSQSYIAAALKCSRSTICRALRKLEEAGLILRRVGERGRTEFTLSATSPVEGVDRKDSRCSAATDLSHQRNQSVAPVDTNNNQGRRIINNQLENTNSLASFLADSLNNPDGLSIYEAYARKYPESVLRRVLSEVKETPLSKIRKSRSHLFTYLLKKYAQ